MNLQVVEMKPEDMDGKAYVHWKSWQETYNGLVDPGYLKEQVTLEFCRNIARKWPENVLVAKVDGKVVGFVGCGPCRDRAYAGWGEIFSIYVLRAYQKQKIGYALMNAAFDRLDGVSHIALWVLQGNDTAIRFYERYGFVFDGVSQPITIGTPNTEQRMVYHRRLCTGKS